MDGSGDPDNHIAIQLLPGKSKVYIRFLGSFAFSFSRHIVIWSSIPFPFQQMEKAKRIK
jgi:hypothetical protein